jgi:hypothetical protein
MAAIDWFFKWSPTSERMHQIVLSGLFRHTRLLRLLGITGEPTDLRAETQRGLYDFTVRLSTETNLNIELKVDAPLGERQIIKQMTGSGDGDLLMYVLLGCTRFAWRRHQLEARRMKVGRPTGADALIRVDLDQMLRGINDLASSSIDDPDQRDLAVAYGSLLRTIHSLTDGFRSKPPAQWVDADWQGFYAELNDRLGIDDGGQGVVNPPDGDQFVGYWWHWISLPLAEEAEAYLQLEQDKLCFKVSVPNANDRATVRNHFSEAVLSCAIEKGLSVGRPRRFGNGHYMAVAKLAGDYKSSDGRALDWELCELAIRHAMVVLESAVRTCGG